jgi:hypothetical protein
MRIRLLTLSAGPGGVIQPGQVVDLPEAMGQALVDGGFAVRVGVQTPPVKSAPESAAIQPAENAARPPAKKRQKRG